MLKIPKRVWISSLTAIGIGLGILIARYLLGEWEWFRKVVGEGDIWKEVVRDVGIAFLVAGVVSVGYEWSTRAAEEHETITDILNKVSSAFTTKDIWNEVNAEIFRRNVIRRNYVVDLSIEDDASLSNSQKVLCVTSRYDLYGLNIRSSEIDVKHHLDLHMRGSNPKLPRFESVVIEEEELQNVTHRFCLKHSYSETDNNLNMIYDEQFGCIKLAGENKIVLPSYEEKRAVRVIIKRREIINIPGLYTVVMTELVAPKETESANTSAEETIRVSVKSFHGVHPEIYRWFPTHEFEPNGDTWIFRGVMLPGQGFSIVFKKADEKDLIADVPHE